MPAPAVRQLSTAPTLWVRKDHTAPRRRAMVWDEKRNKYVKATNPETGMAVFERVPQTGLTGSDLTNLQQRPQSARVRRYLRTDGHVVNLALTESAAVEIDEVRAARADRKNNARGWILEGTCPIRTAFAGLNRGHFHAAETRGPEAKPCPEDEVGYDEEGRLMPPCPHYLAELKARQAVQAARTERENATRDPALKQIEVQGEQVAAIRDLTVALAGKFAPHESPLDAPLDAAPAGKKAPKS